jgi:colanic acid/amylovoran biosynthesis glycosyltransferase
MPRVALFCTNFLPYSMTFVHEQLRQQQRYAVEVFAWRRQFPERFPWQPVHLAEKPYILTRSSRRFKRVFESADFDLVHAHFGPGGTYAQPFAERRGLPLLVTFHGYDVPLLSSLERFLPQHWPYALRGPALLRKMTLGLCASTELYDMLIAHGVPASKLLVYRLGIDLSRFQVGEKFGEEIQVVMVGRFVEKKGFAYGIESFARAAEGRRARLTIVGSGPLESRLRVLTERLGVTERVHFVGALPQPEVAALLARAHVLLAPSVVARGGNRESGLLVVKEASASGAVPIGTLHGGIPESIDHDLTGYLVPERDVASMAEHLRRLIDDRPLRERLARAARLKMEREYDSQERVRALESIYDQVLTSRAER